MFICYAALVVCLSCFLLLIVSFSLDLILGDVRHPPRRPLDDPLHESHWESAGRLSYVWLCGFPAF